MENANEEPPCDADQTAQYYEQCHRWKLQLDEAADFSDVAAVCQDICNYAGTGQPEPMQMNDAADDGTATPDPTLPSSILTSKLLANLNDENKSYSQRKIIAKSYYTLCHRNVLYGAPVDSVYGVSELGSSEENSVAMYGMFNSRFLAIILTLPKLASVVPARNLALFLSPTAGYSRWFNTVSENVLTIERLNLFRNIHTSEQYEKMWQVALNNLESPFHGARENMLTLLKYLVREERFTRNCVLPVVRKWSWMNRNKFHLLVILLGQYRLDTQLKSLCLDMELLGEGLRLSLRYKHLYTGGQALVRLLHKEQRMQGFVYKLAASVIVQEEHGLVQLMAKYWFSCFTPQDYRNLYRNHLNLDHAISEHFEALGVENLFPPYCVQNKHEKLFLLAYLFRRELQKQAYLRPFLLHLCDLADKQKPLPPATIGLLIESLGYYIIACGATDKINTLCLTTHLTRYMHQVMETPGHATVCITIVTVCRNLLKHIAHTQQRPTRVKEFDREAQALVAKFMSYDMYDRYLLPPGTKPIDHQPTVTALRIFAAFVEQFFEFTSTSQYVLQMRPTAKVAWIAKLLPESLPLDELACSFRSMVYGLQHLLRSDYDDVRAIALKMLYNRSIAYHFDPKLQDQLAIVFSRDNEQDTVRSTVHQLLEDTLAKVKDSVQQHRQDFFAAVLAEDDYPNGQLHRLIDRCTEISFGFPAGRALLTNAVLFRVQECVMEVWQLADYAMRCAKPRNLEAHHGTSFELMERSLQLLLDRSAEWNKNHAPYCMDSPRMALAKRRMLVALWKTSRAISILAEHAALWIVENNKDVINGQAFSMFQKYLETLTTIMTTVCHRGAIEAAGNCLNRVVRYLMHLKQHVLTAETAENGVRFQPLKVYTAEVTRLCEQFATFPKTHLDDFRQHRGYIWLQYSILRSDVLEIAPGSPLRVYLAEHMQLARRAAEHEREETGNETVPPPPPMMVLWLHQLNLLARETVLNEAILPHIDDLMIVALAQIRSPQWAVRNAALQLYSSCAAKLTGQRQQYRDPDADWAPVYASFDEVASKANRTIEFMLRQLKTLLPLSERSPGEDERGASLAALRDPATPFLLLVLEFISKLEWRGYRPSIPGDGPVPMVFKYRAIMWQLLRHEHDQVRKLAARSFAQLHDYYTEIANLLEHMVHVLFTSRDSNFRQGLCQAILSCVKKYVTLERYVRRNPWMEEQQHQYQLPNMKSVILKHVREMVERHYMRDREMNFVSTFRFRCELHKLLLYLQFPRDSPIVMELIINRLAPNMHGLDVFVMQLNRVYNSGLSTAPETDSEPSFRQLQQQQQQQHHQQQQHSMPYELFMGLEQPLDQEQEDV
ncbi:uncharacterized protein LOC126567124 [Anopheles maculipalpis]|uniref:uncharacterized protein LOC126567124 n=1 Tax=Anopheles maculipalpis TaxID=1496333 RepID=UPI002158CF02|nr:uncharacterized protein LOC126567124 [Anopheles maculipalpis]